VNSRIDAFMKHYPVEGLTFDDVTLYAEYADFLPHEALVKSRFSRRISLNIPFISAAMDTVTESGMAIAMAMAGGIGVMHKNMEPERQAEEVRRVKSYLNGLIELPVVFPSHIRVAELLAERDRKGYKFSGFPIVDDQHQIVGIVTARDLKFVSDTSVRVAAVMTTPVITAQVGTTLPQAFEIMVKNKVGKLPLVDASGRLAGLYSFHDVKSLAQNHEPDINRDEHHKLRVAAAISPHDYARVERLLRAGVDALIVDTAHGFSKGVLDTVRELKRNYGQVDIIAGNIASGDAAKALVEAGADALKIGIGPGSICTTRVVCGVGIPQITALYDVASAIGREVPIIADGGIRHSGDVPKAMAVGADAVMMGSVLAGTQESPGEKILHQGRTYVMYRGMGSLAAMKTGKGSRERYGQEDTNDESKLVPQGIEGLVVYRGTVDQVLSQFVGGLRFALGYCGSRTLDELRQKARFVRVSGAGLREAHPHDVKIIKDAPNYSSGD
jgi:IMP dehydrogenase